ncbi:MAG TPA: plastocyanin/azurin family copper-binding protein [Candidatus Limnocylindria bacterium]
MTRRLIGIAGTWLAIGVLLAACAPRAAAEPVATDQVNLPPSYRFEPAAITVPDGTTVTWTNNDNFTHNVRLIDDGGEILALPPGESVSFTFTGPGEHRYDCSFHPNDMTGVVVVSES